MTREARQQKIEAYGRAHGVLVEALAQFPQEAWHFKAAPNEWSIHEIVVHITDSEANSYIRCRRFLAEPGQPLVAYDEKQWARELQYGEQDPEVALELFKWLRQASYNLIKNVPDEVWQRTAFHPENGVMRFDDWLDVYTRHVPEHVAQMNRVYEQWRRQQEERSTA